MALQSSWTNGLGMVQRYQSRISGSLMDVPSQMGFDRMFKLARTIADLAGEAQIAVQHLAEALQYRPRGLV